MESPKNYVSGNNLTKVGTETVIKEYFHKLDWQDGDRILDVGCGPGDHTEGIIADGIPCQWSQLVGMDISSAMVEYAQKYHARRAGMSYIQGDIAAPVVPLKDKFNKIISFYCLHWVQNHRQVAYNLIQMLEVGGEALLSFVASNYHFDSYKVQSQNQKWAPYTQDYKNYISPFQDSNNLCEDIGSIYQESGFEIKQIETKCFQYIFKTRDNYKDFLSGVNPFVKRIPKDLQEDYLNNLVDIMVEYSEKVLKNPNIPNDEIIHEYNMIVLHLVRFK